MLRQLSLIALLLLSSPAAAERILSYHSDIEVHADGSMDVTETIRVVVEHDQVRHGIYRDFPTRYEDRLGNDVTVAFEMLGARRDGRAEPYSVKGRINGVRVYLGSERSMAPLGEVTYEIHYRTDRQLGYFGERDELYWNVNGNGWDFPIDSASATVRLPGPVAAQEITTSVYTGGYGSREGVATASVDPDGDVRFETSRGLGPHQGLTIAVDWPAGLVARPTTLDRVGYFFADNAGALVAVAGFALFLWYLIWVWSRVGRDPEAGPIFPHYEPPEGLSAAAVRYLDHMGFDSRAFTATIVSLAVKGRLRIHEDEDGEYTLERRDDPPQDQPLSPGEEAVQQALLSSHSTLTLDQENNATFRRAQTALQAALKRGYEAANFETNGVYLVPAVLIGVGTVVLALILGSPLFAVPTGVVMLPLLALFGYLLKAPTRPGRQLMDRIEGFQLYLSVAEKDELELKNPPEKTPALFERYLPYAIALGAAEAWGSRFESVLLASSRGDDGVHGYHPYWYVGSNFSAMRTASFTASLSSSFSTAISAASTPPGSQPGSGGGGFSGGGGGGGGGGGW